MKRLSLAAIGLMASIVWSGSAAAEEQLKIGIIATLSGGGTAWGQALQRGVQMAVDEANAAGGVTVGGKKFKLVTVSFDDQYSAGQAKTAADRLVNQEGVHYVFGPVASPSALGSLPVTQPAKVLQFMTGYAGGILKNEWKGAYAFRIGNSNLEFSTPIVKWVKSNFPKAKKVGLVAPNDAVGQALLPVLVEAYKSNGFEVWVDYYERGSKEFTPLMLRMLSQNVDLFDLNSNAPGEAALLVKQAREVGFKGQILQAGGSGIDEIIKVAGKLADGFLKYDTVDFDAPEMKPFVAAYNAKYSGIINGEAPTYYNGVQILLEAIRRADSLDTEKVRNELEKTEGFKTKLFGTVRWTGERDYGVNHQILLPFFIKEVKDGRAVVRARIEPR